MQIGLDFDGVISDAITLKIEVAQENFGVMIAPELFKREHVVANGILTSEQYDEVQMIVYGSALGLRMKMLPDTMRTISMLRDEGNNLTIITSRSGQTLDIAKQWADMHGLSLPFIGVGKEHSKRDAALGYDIFVDDDIDKLEPLVDIVPYRFLFSWPYNEHLNSAPIAERTGSWAELGEQILDITKRPS